MILPRLLGSMSSSRFVTFVYKKSRRMSQREQRHDRHCCNDSWLTRRSKCNRPQTSHSWEVSSTRTALLAQPLQRGSMRTSIDFRRSGSDSGPRARDEYRRRFDQALTGLREDPSRASRTCAFPNGHNLVDACQSRLGCPIYDRSELTPHPGWSFPWLQKTGKNASCRTS